MSCLSWVALNGMAHSFIELDKNVVHVISLVIFCHCGFHSVFLLMDKDKRLMEASWWERLSGKLDLVLMGKAMFSKCLIQLIQFSVDVQSLFPPCCLTWGQTTVEVMKIMLTSFKRSKAYPAALNASNPAAGHCKLTLPLETSGHSWECLGKFLVGSQLLSPGSWCAQDYVSF